MPEPTISMDDVKGPDATTQPKNSRPVVVGSTNEVVDNTVVVEKSKKVIAPLSAEEKKTEGVVADAPAPAESDTPVEGSAEVDALAGEVSTKRQDELANKEEEEKKAAVEKIIDSKQYFLNINDSTTGSKLSTVILFLIILAALVGGGAYYYMSLQK